jgi:uncharacterized protein (TIGR00266 family)
MHVEELHGGIFSRVIVHLEPGEGFVSEAGAMYRASSNIDIDVTTRSRGGGGGLLGGLGRLLARGTFFLSTYEVSDGRPGEVGLAPTHMGEVRTLRVTPDTPWMCAGGSFLGAEREVALEARFQGLAKGLLGGEGLALLRASGSGDLVVSAFGMLTEMEVDGELVVDTGHLVAFTEGLDSSIDRVGGGWIATWLAGEGFVLRFSGRGRVLLQSHDPNRFGRILGPLLPERDA